MKTLKPKLNVNNTNVNTWLNSFKIEKIQDIKNLPIWTFIQRIYSEKKYDDGTTGMWEICKINDKDTTGLYLKSLILLWFNWNDYVWNMSLSYSLKMIKLKNDVNLLFDKELNKLWIIKDYSNHDISCWFYNWKPLRKWIMVINLENWEKVISTWDIHQKIDKDTSIELLFSNKIFNNNIIKLISNNENSIKFLNIVSIDKKDEMGRMVSINTIKEIINYNENDDQLNKEKTLEDYEKEKIESLIKEDIENKKSSIIENDKFTKILPSSLTKIKDYIENNCKLIKVKDDEFGTNYSSDPEKENIFINVLLSNVTNWWYINRAYVSLEERKHIEINDKDRETMTEMYNNIVNILLEEHNFWSEHNAIENFKDYIKSSRLLWNKKFNVTFKDWKIEEQRLFVSTQDKIWYFIWKSRSKWRQLDMDNVVDIKVVW